MKHTELPWTADSDMIDIKDQALMLIDAIGTDREWQAVGINDGEGLAEVVALCHPNNAAFIVKAVNNHEALVEALAECSDYLAEFFEEGREHRVVRMADAILAKVKGDK